jgi:hypothetical protein
VPRLDGSMGVDGSERNGAIVARFDVRVGAQADRRIQRERAIVKQVERPDVDGATGEIDPCRSGGNDPHMPDYIGN